MSKITNTTSKTIIKRPVKMVIPMAFVIASSMMTGCATTDGELTVEEQLRLDLKTAKAAEVKAREEADAAETRATKAESKIQEYINETTSENPTAVGYSTVMSQGLGGTLFPPKASAGECYARVFSPAEYETSFETKLIKEAAEELSVIPAEYEWVEEQVLVQEAHEHLKVVPATYKWVEDKVLVEPAQVVKVDVDPVYETKTETVMDKPAHTIWKKGNGPIQKLDESTGEIMCLVEVPATYKTITKRVIKTPATTVEKEIPAVYKIVKRRVIDVPEHTIVDKHPAEYKTVKVKKLIKDEEVVTTEIPAEFTKVAIKTKTKEGAMEWRSILCDTNTTKSLVSKLQQKLKSEGYNPGNIDGVVGMETMRAVNNYQHDNKLPVDKYLNIPTVKHLGLL